MLFDDFKRALTAFADSETDLDFTRGTLLVQVRDELIQAKLTQHAGQLIVDEDGQRLPAASWLINRIARLPLLADRILSYVPATPDFVTPSGRLLDQPDFAVDGMERPCPDASSCTLETLGRRPAGTASVLYLTSDAGEGKTTLINSLARTQAASFKAKRSDWLLVPIPLGGRTFLRFDDVVVAALVNRLRFQLLYYDAFIELVRLGVIVPAFDGFEEMIVSSSSGEAISALGNLVRSLASSGSVMIAARKAYFDYQSFKSQARLFDAIGTDSVAFAKIALDRWNRDQFVEYASKRLFDDPPALHAAVAARLRDDHPLLTRAVLVRRLVDVATQANDLGHLLDQIGSSPQHYFFQFVNAIVEREAHEKWIDQSGEPHQPLMSVEEHHELLGMVAQEMWISTTDALRVDLLATIAEVFAEGRNKPPAVTRQIKERLKQHSLLAAVGTSNGSLAFDHEDFRAFYLGEALGRSMWRRSEVDLRPLVQSGLLPRAAVDEAALHMRRVGGDAHAAISILQTLASAETAASLTRENCGALAVALAEDAVGACLENMSFPEDALRGRQLRSLTVRNSYFQGSSLAGTTLTECVFDNCRFERLELSPDTNATATLEHCDVAHLVLLDRDEQLFAPAQIQAALSRVGLKTALSPADVPDAAQAEPDESIWLLERAMRIFMRANQVNEDVFRMKLGVKAPPFLDEVLPTLLRSGVIEVVPYLGQGNQRRFRIGVPMQRIQSSLAGSGGKFARFLELVRPPR